MSLFGAVRTMDYIATLAGAKGTLLPGGVISQMAVMNTQYPAGRVG
jgi:hypothetical protein